MNDQENTFPPRDTPRDWREPPDSGHGAALIPCGPRRGGSGGGRRTCGTARGPGETWRPDPVPGTAPRPAGSGRMAPCRDRISRRLRAALAGVPLAAIAGLGVTARAGSFVVWQDDQSGFAAALAGASTVVDSHGAFAPDPAAGTGLASVTRSGSVAGQAFSFEVRDVNFSNSPNGVLSAGNDIASASTLAVETPVANGTATGTGSFGYDSQGATDGTTTRNALLVDFTTTPGGLGIGHFALELVDFEAGATPGQLRLYDGGLLVFSSSFTFPGPGFGNNETHFLGVVGIGPDSLFDQVVLVVGDEAGSPNSENWAADRFQFGAVANPEPGTCALVGAGVAGLAAAVVRRKRRGVGPGASGATPRPGPSAPSASDPGAPDASPRSGIFPG